METTESEQTPFAAVTAQTTKIQRVCRDHAVSVTGMHAMSASNTSTVNACQGERRSKGLCRGQCDEREHYLCDSRCSCHFTDFKNHIPVPDVAVST